MAEIIKIQDGSTDVWPVMAESVLDVAANNYVKFSNGMMIQWGSITIESIAAGTTGNTTVTYVIPFDATPAPRVFATKRTASPHTHDIGVTAANNNSFQLNIHNGSSSTMSPSANWLAIGRWK